MEENLFGQILINNNFISKEDLEKALAMQKQSKKHKLLGEFLVEQGFLSASMLNSILSIQRRKVQLSDQTAKVTATSEMSSLINKADLSGLLEAVASIGASDLYLNSNLRPAIRLHGNLVDIEHSKLDKASIEGMLFTLMEPEEQITFLNKKDFEKSVDLESGRRCRMNVFQSLSGIAGAFRIFPKQVLTLKELGLPNLVKDFALMNRGFLLVTGPASSGKSTTLNAIVEEINLRRRGHMVIIENPVEVVFEPRGCIITQREVGKHTKSFAVALRAALREDPDFIVISELRDLDTIQTAIQAAETGHLVLGTMPTGNAVRTLHRMIDAFPPSQQNQIRGMLAGILKAIISQQLIPNMDGRGRSIAQEILISNPAVANFIRESRIYQIPSAIQIGKEYGMKLMDDSLLELVKAKKITLEEAFDRAENKERFATLKL